MSQPKFPFEIRDVEVIGFCHGVRRGCIGMENIIFRHMPSNRCHIWSPSLGILVGGGDTTWDNMVRKGEPIVTLQCRPYTFLHHGILMYVHKDFVLPNMDFISSNPELYFDDDARAYLGYMHIQRQDGLRYEWSIKILKIIEQRFKETPESMLAYVDRAILCMYGFVKYPHRRIFVVNAWAYRLALCTYLKKNEMKEGSIRVLQYLSPHDIDLTKDIITTSEEILKRHR